MKIKCRNSEAVVKRAFFLAYEAAALPRGMGTLQARQSASEDDVWANVRSAGDYPQGFAELTGASEPGQARGDYVFGRMMKLRLWWDDEGVTVPTQDPSPDYQSWCVVYPTYQTLVEVAALDLCARRLHAIVDLTEQ